jgi:hypothetical protein
VPAKHELVLHRILNPLDLQFFSPDCAAEDLFDHLFRAILDRRLGGFWKRIILLDAVMGFEGAFDGQKNSRLIKLLEAPVAFPHEELPAKQGVNSLHLQLIMRHIRHFELDCAKFSMSTTSGVSAETGYI